MNPIIIHPAPSILFDSPVKIKQVVALFLQTALVILLILPGHARAGTVDVVSLSPADSTIEVGATQLLTLEAVNTTGQTLRKFKAEYNYPAGVTISNLQATPTARRAEIDTSKLRIKLEWRNVSDGTALSALFTVSSDSEGDYALTPRKIRYEFSDRTRVNGTGNTAVVHVTTPSVNQPPIADAGPDQTVEATSATGATVTFDGTGSSDPDGDPLTYDWNGSFGSAAGASPTVTIPVGSETVTLTVTDTSSATGSDTVQITVQDTTAPTLSNIPSDQTVEATSASGAVATYTSPTAADSVDPSPIVSCSPTSGNTFSMGATTVTCTASDIFSNSSSATFTITINDTTAPILSNVPSDQTVEATSASGAIATYVVPTATDTVDPNPIISCSPASGSSFSLGLTTVICTATDASGNSSQATFTITVQDSTPPTLTNIPSDQTVEATSASGAVASYTSPTATDSVDPSPIVSCSPTSGSTFAMGDTTVTCTASDTNANSSQATFTITVGDTLPPILSNVPSDLTVEAAGASGAVVNYADPTATDPVDPNPTVSCSPLSGSTFSLGTTTVTCTASDMSSNSSQATFTITVQDTSGPTLSNLPSNQTVEATSASGAVVSYADPTATDIVDPNPTVSCSPVSGSTFTIGSTTITCTATDAGSNSAQGTFSVTVGDTTAPILSNLPMDQTVQAPDSSGAVVNYTDPTAADAVDPNPTVSCSPVSGIIFVVGVTTVTCIATDSSTNLSQATFMVIVIGPTSIAGKVTEADRITPIAGATIQIYDGSTGVGIASTDSNGDYSIEIPPSSGAGSSSKLTTISTRAYVETGNGLAIAGFIISGTDPMTVLIRTTAPGLADSGISDVLPDPSIRLYSGPTSVAQNDNWQTTDPMCDAPVMACGDMQAITDTGLDPCVDNNTSCNLESAMLVTLPPGVFTTFLFGVGSDPTGIGLISVFDVDPASTSKLISLSTRANVELGEGTTRAQFVVQGNDLTTVLIKTTGPNMEAHGLDPLADPSIQLYSGQTLIAWNDDWQITDPLCAAPAVACGDAQAISDTGSDPCVNNNIDCDLDSALLVTLPPGVYTAEMRGEGSDPTGIGLIAINDLNSSGGLPSGTYTVQASVAGYITQNQTGVTVNEGTTTTVDFSLDPVSSGNNVSANNWSPEVDWISEGNTVAAMHLSLLPDGNLIAMGPNTFKMVPTPLGEPLPTKNTVINMNSQVPYEEIGDSLYASGHTLLGDGTFFTVGGLTGLAGWGGVGLPYAMTYDNSLGWMRVEDHLAGLGDTPEVGPRRWYPAVTRLADSRVLVTAGRDFWQGSSSENRSVEIFDPASASWSLASSHSDAPEEIFNGDYTHVFQLPNPIGNSDVIMFGEDGYPVLFSTATGDWDVRLGGHRPPGSPVLSNSGTSSLMLPIRINNFEWGYSNGAVLMAGGTHNTDFEQNVDIYDPVLDTWHPSIDMAVRRHHPSTVLLPDGRILIVAGHNNDPNSISPGYAQYIDPANNFQVNWSQSAFNETRGYHTVTLLLPDGRVLVGGGNPGVSAGNERPDFRYFYPDYFAGSRPEIMSLPDQFDYNSSNMVTWQNANSVSEVVLLGMGSMTHSIDFSQRHVQLLIQGSASGSTSFLAPPNSMVAPPGYYLLFVLDENRKPSVGKIVQLGNPPTTERPLGPPLIAVQKSLTSTNSTELHFISGATNFQTVMPPIGTALPETDGTWEFEWEDWDGDSIDDLIGIQKSGTASGSTEVTILSGATNFQSVLLQTGTAFPETDDTWEFEFTDWEKDSILDLVGIHKSSTGSGSTEINILSGSSNFQLFLYITPIPLLGETDSTWEFAFENWNGDYYDDLVGIKKSSTGTLTTEVHILSGANVFQIFLLQTGTALPETDGTWEFQFADWNKDSNYDLIGIQKSATVSGSTEVYILSGHPTPDPQTSADSYFQEYLLQTLTGTVFPETDNSFQFLFD